MCALILDVWFFFRLARKKCAAKENMIQSLCLGFRWRTQNAYTRIEIDDNDDDDDDDDDDNNKTDSVKATNGERHHTLVKYNNNNNIV